MASIMITTTIIATTNDNNDNDDDDNNNYNNSDSDSDNNNDNDDNNKNFSHISHWREDKIEGVSKVEKYSRDFTKAYTILWLHKRYKFRKRGDE